jgi:hypothetical protein
VALGGSVGYSVSVAALRVRVVALGVNENVARGDVSDIVEFVFMATVLAVLAVLAVLPGALPGEFAADFGGAVAEAASGPPAVNV